MVSSVQAPRGAGRRRRAVPRIVEHHQRAWRPLAAARTAGLVADSAALALAAHLLLGYPGGRLRRRARSAVVTCRYAVLVGVVGIAPMLFFAPAATGCPQCPSNLLLPTDNPATATALGKRAGWLGVAWITAIVVVVIVGRITRRLPPTRDGTIGVLATGIGFLVCVRDKVAITMDR